jgi:hypothetical protein
MRFVVFVEGYSEKRVIAPFLKRWLDPRLKKPIGVNVVRFEGWSELVNDVEVKARMHLQNDDVVVISLLDLYGPTFYPGNAETARERESWGRKHFEKKINHPRYRHFFAVHESEAWLLSQAGIFPAEVRAKLPDKIRTPEQVNFDEPPSYLLDKVYRATLRRPYKKIVYGAQLFNKLDPEEAYKKCPYLKSLLDEMLAIAQAAA